MSAHDDPFGVRRATDEGMLLEGFAEQPRAPRVLVTAASRHGATAEIAEAIASTLRHQGLEVVVMAPEDVEDVDGYDGVVLGSAVYSGRWLPAAGTLANRCGPALRRRPVWLFSSGPVGDPARRLVQKMGVDPVDLPSRMSATGAREHRMFAGRLDRRRLTRPQRVGLALVRGLHGDFRDWAAVAAWAREIADALAVGAATETPAPAARG